jgi:hypothetical protein
MVSTISFFNFSFNSKSVAIFFFWFLIFEHMFLCHLILNGHLCGTYNQLCVSNTKIPFSHINVNSLCCWKMSYFILAIAIYRYDYNLDWNIIVRKLLVVGVCKLFDSFKKLYQLLHPEMIHCHLLSHNVNCH